MESLSQNYLLRTKLIILTIILIFYTNTFLCAASGQDINTSEIKREINYINAINHYLQARFKPDRLFITSIDTSLVNLVGLHNNIKNIHPFLESLQPIAVVKADYLFIFDLDSSKGKYKFQKKEPVPFQMPAGIRASFPLSVYNNKPTCIVTDDAFKSLEEYVIIFHEFVHCFQANTIEYELKSKLNIYQEAMNNADYSWEINYPFPYNDSVFVNCYSGFIESMAKNDYGKVKEYRDRLKSHLNDKEYEYIVWQEWKEGFARLIENKIRKRLKLEENKYGKDLPFHRVSFYYGGEKYINYLTDNDENLFLDLEKLFEKMLN